jgi:hypothetical protein
LSSLPLNIKAFEFTKSFSKLEVHFPLPMSRHISGICAESFVKQQAITWRFSKDFVANPGNVLANRKQGAKFERE